MQYHQNTCTITIIYIVILCCYSENKFWFDLIWFDLIIYLWHRWCPSCCTQDNTASLEQCRQTGRCEEVPPTCRRLPEPQQLVTELAASIPRDIVCVDSVSSAERPSCLQPKCLHHIVLSIIFIYLKLTKRSYKHNDITRSSANAKRTARPLQKY